MQSHYIDFNKLIQNAAANTQEVDCSQVDVEEIENAGLEVVENVKDMVVNVNIADMQFDIDAMYEEAKKLGLDAGDLVDYGFEKRPGCGGKSCFNPDKIKNYDDFLNKTEMFGDKIVRSGSEAYKKAMCSKYFRETVHPKVELFWAMFPFDCCLGFSPTSLILNAITLPFTFCFIIPFYQWVVIPWNIAMTIGLGPLCLLFACPCVGGFTIFNTIYQYFSFVI